MSQKTFKTLDEQIDILKGKGLIIDDVDNAKTLLLRENYFFISGYRHLFMGNDKRNYIPGTNFREVYALFSFDRAIRNIIFKNLLIIENNVKSVFSYQLSKKYGYHEKNYLNSKNFTSKPEKQKQLNDLLKKMKRQIRVNGNQHSATMHYNNNYGYIPMWILVKVLSFGIVSELFSVMKEEDQNEIAKTFGVDAEVLTLFLPVLANFRNLCAHEDILYEHKTQKNIPDTKYHYRLDIPVIEDIYIYGKSDLYALIIILKILLLKDNFTLLMNEISYEIDLLAGKLQSINIDKVLDKMGFPANYNEIVRID